MIIKKNIFLSNKEKSKTMGILTLENKNNGIWGNIKLFNSIVSEELVLGIKHNEKIYKQNIYLNNNQYSFKIQDNIDLNNKISCVLVNVINNNISPIVWGYEVDDNYKKTIINSLKNSINKIQANTLSSLNKGTENNQVDVCNETINNQLNEENIENNSKEIENSIANDYAQISMDEEILNNENLDEIACAQSNVHNLFDYNQEEVDQEIDREFSNIDNIPDEKSSQSINPPQFYTLIAGQLDELFTRYPREKNLEMLIDNSQWVKIESDSENKFYVVGIIKDESSVVKYICYGVPGNYYSEPPMELRGYSQWLPTDTADPYNNGYWVMYQDSETGENVYIN